MSNIFLGAIDNLAIEDITPWITSVKKVRQAEDIVMMVVYRTTKEVIRFLVDNGVIPYEVNHDSMTNPIVHQISNSPTVSHNMRMFHFWEVLTRLSNTDKLIQTSFMNSSVIITDVRDVYFQEYPFSLIAQLPSDKKIIVGGECLPYKSEEWGLDNLQNGFGPIFTELSSITEHQILNVGAIMGKLEHVKDLCHIVYCMTQGRHYPSDQSSFNVLVRSSLFRDMVHVSQEFAAHLGTTADPTKSHLWARWTETPPAITSDRLVMTAQNTPYKLVHQWDRVPELKEKVRNS